MTSNIVPAGFAPKFYEAYLFVEHHTAKTQEGVDETTWQGYSVIVITDLANKGVTLTVVAPFALLESAFLITQLITGLIRGKCFVAKNITLHSLCIDQAQLYSSLLSLPKKKYELAIDVTALYQHHQAVMLCFSTEENWPALLAQLTNACAKHQDLWANANDIAKLSALTQLRSLHKTQATIRAIKAAIFDYYVLVHLLPKFISIPLCLIANPLTTTANIYITRISQTGPLLNIFEKAFKGALPPLETTLKETSDALDPLRAQIKQADRGNFRILLWKNYNAKNAVHVNAAIDWFKNNREEWMTDEIWNEIMINSLNYPAFMAIVKTFILENSSALDPLGFNVVETTYQTLTEEQKKELRKKLVLTDDTGEPQVVAAYHEIMATVNTDLQDQDFLIKTLRPAIMSAVLVPRGEDDQ